MKTNAKDDIAPSARVTYGSGKFIFPNGAVYAGEWAIVEPIDPAELAAEDADGILTTSNTIVQDTSAVSHEDMDSDFAKTVRSTLDKDIQTERGQVCAGVKQRHGFGRYQHGPELYMGWWLHDMMHGRGRFESDVGCYEGDFINGRFHGRGSYQWPSGAWYAGEWVNNKMHGHGTFVSADGHTWEGTFHNDYFITREGDWLLPCTHQQQIWANPTENISPADEDEEWETAEEDAE